MKVFLLQDVEKVGIAGEIIKVKDGFAANFLFPHKFAVEVTKKNAKFYTGRAKTVEQRKEIIHSKTSMLAEKIKSIKIKIKRKLHDDGKLYGSVSASEVVDLLNEKGIKISKSQVEFGKSIKEKGSYSVTIKLSSKLQPKIKLEIVSE